MQQYVLLHPPLSATASHSLTRSFPDPLSCVHCPLRPPPPSLLPESTTADNWAGVIDEQHTAAKPMADSVSWKDDEDTNGVLKTAVPPERPASCRILVESSQPAADTPDDSSAVYYFVLLPTASLLHLSPLLAVLPALLSLPPQRLREHPPSRQQADSACTPRARCRSSSCRGRR